MGSTGATDPAAVAGFAVRAFADAYRRQPDVTWSAPGRANLIGEHTDYNDGFVLPFAITRRTAVAAARRDDGVITVRSTFAPEAVVTFRAADIAPGAVDGWAGYPLGVAWALAQVRDVPAAAGADLFIHSDVPAGAGLSSSAAVEMAAAGALAALWGLDLSPAELARAGQRAENEIVGAPTGVMDQYASLLGQADAAVFLDCRSLRARAVPLRLNQAGLTLVLTDTGERHAHATGGYAARRASCERGAARLGVPALRDLGIADLPRAEAVLDAETFRRVRHVVTEDARVEATVADLEAGDLAAVGRQLTASHQSMRDDYEITTRALDLAVEAALSAGALGARMTGGGFGGSAITLIEAARVPRLTAAVEAAFSAAGFARPRIGTVTPGPGAHREA
ncbi:MAG TPA: galactokinase [Trebonia sp.]